MDEDQFKYVWEYHFLGDHTTKRVCKIVNTSGAICNGSAPTFDCSGTGYRYNISCQTCKCHDEIDQEFWYKIGEDDKPSIVWTATRQGDFNQVAFRYRLKHISNGTAGPPSDSTGYVTIYDPPPVLNYADNNNENYNQASEANYDNGDLSIKHVSCQGGTDGQITVKNVSGGPGREYFYTLRGPVDNPANNVMTDAVGGSTWNINGQGKPTPRPNEPDTWFTFPEDDPTGVQQLPAGTYWLVVENWDDREPNTPSPFENTKLRACYVARKITIQEPAAGLSAALGKREYEGNMHVSCYEAPDGQITLNAAGGIDPYRYLLREVGRPYRAQSSATFSNLAAHRNGTTINYEYYVTDAMGCLTDAKSFTLDFPSPLTVDYAVPTNHYPNTNSPYHIQCFGGTDSASVYASGGVPPYAVHVNGIILRGG